MVVRSVVLLAAGLLGAPAVVDAAQLLCVTPGGGGGCFAAIGAALAAAQPGDTVRVATGTYVENVLLTQPVTLQGGWNPGFTTRDPATLVTTIRPAMPLQSVVTIDAAGAAVFEGFVVTGGRADLGFNHGGGVRVVNSDAVLRDNVIAGNRAYLLGGGIWVQGGAPRLAGNRIEGNRVTGDATESAQGGGVAWQGDGGLLAGNTIVGNAVETPQGFGGGLLVAGSGPVTVRGGAIADNAVGACTVIPNTEPYGGGGVFVGGTAPVTLDALRVSGNCAALGGGIFTDVAATAALLRSTVTENAGADGGGIVNRGTLTIRDSGITANTATGVGAGISSSSGGVVSVLRLVNTTISANAAGVTGGGLLVDGSLATAELFNVTVTSNIADADANASGRGGGIFNFKGFVTLSHTVLAGNRRGLADIPDDCEGGEALTFLAPSLVQTPGGCTLNGDFTGGQFSVDPQLGPLADNGGPTPTHALLATSPARDAGLPAACPATDQRGVPRPQGAACDLGAYEVNDDPFLFLALNATAFGPGETMVLTAELIPGLVPLLVDAYIVIRLPDGTLLSLVPAGAVPGIAPVATGFVPPPFRGEVVRYTFQGHEPAGTFDWFAALVRSGTLAILGAVAEAPFTFSP